MISNWTFDDPETFLKALSCVKTGVSLNMLLDCLTETSHMYKHTYTPCVILTWRSWWKAPLLVLDLLQLLCLQGDVTQSREMNWATPTHRVGLTKQCWVERWFRASVVQPVSLTTSGEYQNTKTRFHASLSTLICSKYLWFMHHFECHTSGDERTHDQHMLLQYVTVE